MNLCVNKLKEYIFIALGRNDKTLFSTDDHSSWKYCILDLKVLIDQWDNLTTDIYLNPIHKNSFLSEMQVDRHNLLDENGGYNGQFSYHLYSAQIHFDDNIPQKILLGTALDKNG